MLASVNGRIPAIDRLTYEQSVSAARADLGDEAYTAACAEGRAMTVDAWEKLVDDVLSQNAEADLE
jgi:hypothetical protein